MSNFPKTEVQDQFVAFERRRRQALRKDLLREQVHQQILAERSRQVTEKCDYQPFKSCYAQDFSKPNQPTGIETPSSDDLYQTDNAITLWNPDPLKRRSMKRRNDFTKPNAEDYATQFR